MTRRMICVNDSKGKDDDFMKRFPLTKGKIYLIKDNIDGYKTISDNGQEVTYIKFRFEEIKKFINPKITVL